MMFHTYTHSCIVEYINFILFEVCSTSILIYGEHIFKCIYHVKPILLIYYQKLPLKYNLVYWKLTLKKKYAVKVVFFKQWRRYNMKLINCSLTHSRTIYSSSTQHHVLKLTEWGWTKCASKKVVGFPSSNAEYSNM